MGWEPLPGFRNKDLRKAYPELRELLELKTAIKEAEDLDRESRWESGEFTWEELGAELQPELVKLTLGDLESGHLEAVKKALEKWPELSQQDSRLEEFGR